MQEATPLKHFASWMGILAEVRVSVDSSVKVSILELDLTIQLTTGSQRYMNLLTENSLREIDQVKGCVTALV